MLHYGKHRYKGSQGLALIYKHLFEALSDPGKPHILNSQVSYTESKKVDYYTRIDPRPFTVSFRNPPETRNINSRLFYG